MYILLIPKESKTTKKTLVRKLLEVILCIFYKNKKCSCMISYAHSVSEDNRIHVRSGCLCAP